MFCSISYLECSNIPIRYTSWTSHRSSVFDSDLVFAGAEENKEVGTVCMISSVSSNGAEILVLNVIYDKSWYDMTVRWTYDRKQVADWNILRISQLKCNFQLWVFSPNIPSSQGIRSFILSDNFGWWGFLTALLSKWY
jgi:hypothetical protein